MAAADIIKNYSLFVDGRGYAGQVTEFNAPELAIQTEDFRAGGMDAPVALDMGMEGLETSFTLSKYDADVLSLFGIANGAAVQATVRAAAESYDGTVRPVVYNMRGRITRIARGAFTAGAMVPITITMRLDYYRETVNDVVIHEIDVVNMIRTIAGVDRLAEQRAALGL